MFKRIISAALLGVAQLVFAAPSSINPTVPAQGSLVSSGPIRTNFLAAYNDINALIQKNSGPTSPLLPLVGQEWLNTGVTPYTINVYDGGAWVQVGVLDNVNHISLLPVAAGGTGSGTAAGARANLGLTIGSNVEAWNVNLDALASVGGGVGNIPYFTGANTMSAANMSGDCSNVGMTITCLLTNGRLFAPSATVDTTNASNIVSGTLLASLLPTPTISSLGGVQAINSVSHQWISSINTSGVPQTTQPACGDLSNSTSACSTAIGTSGATIPLLNGNNTLSGNNTYSGTANFTNTFSIGGTTETFPASGAIVGTSDTQTLTNKSIAGSEINSGTVAAARLPVATSGAQGIVQTDGSTISVISGVISCTTATTSQAGCVVPDGSTITVAAGVISASLSGVSYNGFINGCGASNDGTTPNTVLDIAACTTVDSTNSVLMKSTSTFTKTTSGTFVAGTGNAGMGTGLTVAASTWYHVFQIKCSGAIDFYFDTSMTAANKPACASNFRYVADFKTDGASHIVTFFQNGNEVIYGAAVADVSAGGSTTATLTTLTVPLGVTVYPIMNVNGNSGGATSVWSPILGSSYAVNSIVAPGNQYLPPTNLTNTSSQLYFKIGTAGDLSVQTIGYVNLHLAPNF